MAIIPFPKHPRQRRNDAKVHVWLGELWRNYRYPLRWVSKTQVHFLEPPRSVTFPICRGCGHVIWDWPHFEEEVPDEAICEECFKEEETPYGE